MKPTTIFTLIAMLAVGSLLLSTPHNLCNADGKTINSQDLFRELQSVREVTDKHDARLTAIEQRVDTLERIPREPPISTATAVQAPDDSPCVKIDGIDTDIEEYLSEWITDQTPQVTFDGTKDSLLQHLREHQITEADDLSLATLNSLHTARIEQEVDEGKRPVHAAPKTETDQSAKSEGWNLTVGLNPLLETPAPAPPSPQTTNSGQCVNGQCSQVRTVQRTVQHYQPVMRPATRAQQRRAARRGW